MARPASRSTGGAAPEAVGGPVDPLEVAPQMEDLRKLEDGWLNGEGVAPPAEGLEWLADAFGKHYPAELPLPHIYPTPTGGAQLEWRFGSYGVNVEVEVDLATRIAEWFVLDLSSREATTDFLDLSVPTGWSLLRERIGRLVTPAS